MSIYFGHYAALEKYIILNMVVIYDKEGMEQENFSFEFPTFLPIEGRKSRRGKIFKVLSHLAATAIIEVVI